MTTHRNTDATADDIIRWAQALSDGVERANFAERFGRSVENARRAAARHGVTLPRIAGHAGQIAKSKSPPGLYRNRRQRAAGRDR